VEVQVVRRRDNPLLMRREVHFQVTHTGEPTPRRTAVQAALAEVLKAKKENIVVDRMRTEFGKEVSHGYAKVYSSVEAASRFERDSRLVRMGLKEKKAKGAKAEGGGAPKKEEKK
jgi:small subunit ribosomal protein S24e